MIQTNRQENSLGFQRNDKQANISPDKKYTIFSIEEDRNAEVLLAGSFNNWQPEPMKWDAKKQIFTKKKLLTLGIYEYKFVINGEWVIDFENEDFTYNNHGSMNSIKEVW